MVTTIDGTGGGGQILRSSLSLGAILGKSFIVTNIRAKRPKPGWQAQHLTWVQAVQATTQARRADGAELGHQSSICGTATSVSYPSLSVLGLCQKGMVQYVQRYNQLQIFHL